MFGLSAGKSRLGMARIARARKFHGPHSRLESGAGSGYLSAMSITVIVENDTIKLAVHVPDGTRVEVTLPLKSPTNTCAEKEETLYDSLKDFIGRARAAGGFRSRARSLLARHPETWRAMKRVFGDASYFLALANPRDSGHLAALELARQWRGEVVTTPRAGSSKTPRR